MTISNAYQVAAVGGFPGTEAQWLASLSIRSRIMFALADLLQGAAPEGESDIPWLVDNPGSRRPQLFLDASRVAGPGDWVVIDLGMEGEGLDQPGDICRVISSLPVVVTISMPRQPGDPPNWQLLDPFYVAVHGRVMGGTRKLGGLCRGIQSKGRSDESNLQAALMRCVYDVTYATDQTDVKINRL
jgi:hypothetical protein